MDWMLIITLIGTIATVISTILAVRAKNKAQTILKQVQEVQSRNIRNNGSVHIINEKTNTGIISGINSGEIHNER